MKRSINIAVVGLGQIGNYLFNELKNKKSDIEKKTGKKIKVVAISAKNPNKAHINIFTLTFRDFKKGVKFY